MQITGQLFSPGIDTVVSQIILHLNDIGAWLNNKQQKLNPRKEEYLEEQVNSEPPTLKLNNEQYLQQLAWELEEGAQVAGGKSLEEA